MIPKHSKHILCHHMPICVYLFIRFYKVARCGGDVKRNRPRLGQPAMHQAMHQAM